MKRHKLLLVLFAVLIAVYVWQLWVIPIDQASLAKYQLRQSQAQLLRMTIAIPYIIIWLMALFGYIKIRRYAQVMKHTTEVRVWRYVALGLLVATLSMPLNTIIANWSSSTTSLHPSWVAPVTVISNYINLGLILFSVSCIYYGLKRLYHSDIVNRRQWQFGPVYTFAFLVLSAIFTALTMTNPARQYPAAHGVAAYYLPDTWLIVTIVVPYIYVWYAGIRSIEYLHAYKFYVTGALYKSALQSLAWGLSLVVASWIGIRVIISMTTFFNSATLRIVLLILYVLLLTIGVGYGFIARGAKRLTSIEEA